MKFYYSRPKLTLDLLLPLIISLLTYGVLFIVITHKDKIDSPIDIRWVIYLLIIAAGFFTFSFLFDLKKLLKKSQPVILIGENGIEDKRLDIGIISWRDISVIQFHGGEPERVLSLSSLLFKTDYYLIVHVKNSDKYLRDMTFIKKMKLIMMPPFIISFGHMANFTQGIFSDIQAMQKKSQLY